MPNLSATKLGAIAATRLRRLSEAVDNQVALMDWRTSSEVIEVGAVKCHRITITLDCNLESYPEVLHALAKPVTDQD